MAFDYPNGTWTVASIPLLVLLLIGGWIGLRKQRKTAREAEAQYEFEHPSSH